MRRPLSAAGLVLGLLMVAAVVWLWASGSGKPMPGEMPTVNVERGTVELTVTADGTLEPLTTVNVKSYAGGRVDLLAVEVGDEVKQGQLIAKIDPTDSLTAHDQAVADLAAARARLEQAQEQAKAQPALTQAAIAQAEATYSAALKDLECLREATQPQARAQARAALDKARANAEIAEAALTRMQELEARGFVSRSDLDDAANRRELARAELTSAEEQWSTLERQLTSQLQAAEARVAQARAALARAETEAVQDRLSQADVASAKAQVARAEAAVTNARTELDYTTIAAPRDGVILDIFVEEGTLVTSGKSSVTQGTDIVLLGDLTRVFLEVSLDEADVALIEIGQGATIVVDAFPEEEFHGSVTRIDPQALTQQNVTTVLVSLSVDDADPRLKLGMTATCEFLIGRAENVLRLPHLAVPERDGRHAALVLQDGQLRPIPIEVGLVGDNFTEVRQGIDEGASVVLPLHGESPGSRRDWAKDRGRRMGGAGGFVRGR